MQLTTIEQVTLQQVKGRTAEVALAPLSLILAPNGSGKTAVTDAVKLALTGKHPVHGAKGKALMELASGTAMAAGVRLSDGRAFSRSWTMDKRGSVKAVADLPDGWASEDDAALIFSPGQFLAMNDKDRVATLLRLGGETAPTVAEVETLRDKLEDQCTGGSRLTLADFDPFADAHGDAAGMLQAAEVELIEARKAHKRDVARLQNTLKGLEDAAAAAEAPPKVDQQQVDEASDELRKRGAECARLGERYREAARKRSRAEELDSKSHWTRAHAETLEKVRADLLKADTATSAWSTAKEELGRLLAGAAEPEELEEAKAALEGGEPEAPEGEREEAGAAVKRCEEGVMEVVSQLRQLDAKSKEIESKRDAAAAMECCPTCGATGEDFRERVVESFDRELVEISALHARLSQKRIDAEQALVAARRVLDRWTEYDRKVQARELLDRDAAGDKRIEELRSVIAENQQGADNRPRLAEQVAELEQAEKVAQALADLGDVPTDEQVQALKAAVDTAEAARVDLETAFRLLREKQQRWLEFGAQSGHIDRARQELEQAKAKLEQTEALVAEVVAGKQALAAQVVGPLARDLRLFTDGVLPGRVLLDEGLGIHYEADGSRRCFRALSGSEQAVIAFALAAALAMRTPLKVALLDEASTMDAERKGAFLKAVADAVANGLLAQAVVIDHDPRAALPGWVVQSFGKA